LDADTLLASNITLGLAKVADAVLISVRVGRPPALEDRLLNKMIALGRYPLLGAIASLPKAIADFDRHHKAGTLPFAGQRDFGNVPSAGQRVRANVAV
jgi:hypothetical protein